MAQDRHSDRWNKIEDADVSPWTPENGWFLIKKHTGEKTAYSKNDAGQIECYM